MHAVTNCPAGPWFPVTQSDSAKDKLAQLWQLPHIPSSACFKEDYLHFLNPEKPGARNADSAPCVARPNTFQWRPFLAPFEGIPQAHKITQTGRLKQKATSALPLRVEFVARLISGAN